MLMAVLPAGRLEARDGANQGNAAPATWQAASNGAAPAALPRAVDLLASLGDDNYVVRRNAEQALLSRGEAVRSMLLSAVDTHVDPEVRQRSRQLVAALDSIRARQYREALEARLTAFVEGELPQASDEAFPGWKAFRESIGGDRTARELFAQMHRSEPELLSQLAGDPREFSRSLSARLLKITQSLSHPLPYYRTAITPGRAAALFFAATRADVELDTKTASQLYSMASQQTIRPALAESGGDPMFRKVVGRWVALDQKGDRNLAYYKVLLATQHDLKEGREAGLNLLRDDKAAATSYQYLQALLAVARFGTEKDVEVVEPLLKNNTVCQTTTMSVNNVRRTYTTQVRDVALAVLVHLTGQDHRAYGFDRLQKNPRTVFASHTLGFEKDNDKGREEGLAKWQRWKAGRSKQP
jgi:hypothetical protein